MKKKALIFGTLGASLLLAGGVFAAYTVTDNAAKIGIKISPTEIQEEAVGTVTLTWGENHATTFTNISNLSIGSPQTKSVVVKADAVDAENQATSYTGKLSVELQDLSNKTGDAKKLIDYLHVDVKKGGDTLGELGRVTANQVTSTVTSGNYNIQASASGVEVSFVVSIDAAAGPYINSINTDQVYLSVDWMRSGNEDGVKHVYIPSNGWTSMYVYSYSSSGQNTDFPGEALQVDSETGFFVADLLDSHTNFIFSEVTNNVVTNRYPADGEPGMTRTQLGIDTTGNIYFDWTNHTFVSTAPVEQAPFYLVGEATESWSQLAAYGFEVADTSLPTGVDHQWHATVTVVTGKDYKICSADKTIWVGKASIETAEGVTLTGDDNFQFSEAGDYSIYVKHFTADSGSYGAYIAKA
ncbi:MAG: hypothetical protein K5906_00615 [Bacilli bacterium]|nr:hypothetical protein [Bacilli bacterium]